jgi:hypothetical protein
MYASYLGKQHLDMHGSSYSSSSIHISLIMYSPVLFNHGIAKIWKVFGKRQVVTRAYCLLMHRNYFSYRSQVIPGHRA